MGQRLTAGLHELVYAMDAYSDRVLRSRFDVDRNLFAFLVPLSDGTLDVTRLAERLNLTRAAVSKRVPVLERDGWVTTRADGRRVLVDLTPTGRDLVARAGVLLNGRFAALMADVDIEVDVLDTHVRTLIDAVRALDAEDGS
ncbi:MAG TPA: MarR family transcriptional regulator [Propionibacteriaceae bacterium]|nr:MarR family transcriptional regulator [Propionibacteriaceae bacterium]